MEKQIVRLCIILLSLACFVSAQNVSVKTDKPDAIYDVNCPVIFTISCPNDGQIEYVLSNDGRGTIRRETLKCETGDINITGTLDRPGFLLCSVVFTPSGEGKPQKAAAGAGFELGKIKPAENCMPADFDEFWQKKKQQLAAVPMNPVLTPVACEQGMEMYDVNLACVGKPVRGYYAKPVNAKKGSCPAIAFFQGAGVRSTTKGWITEYCKEGFIALEINAHGIPNSQPEEYYKNLHKTTLKGYQFFGKENPDDYYFVGMYLRLCRALEFLKAQPEWDGKNLIAYGSSQGGAQSIAAAGLNPDVTFVFAAVPAMCDHGGYICGWPRLAPVEEDGGYNQKILNTSRYFDGVNFASKIKIPAFVTVGFIDQTCRPTSVYAMYNTYSGPKEIFNAPLMGHSIPKEHQQMAKERILKNLHK